jgi:hypothetical protein
VNFPARELHICTKVSPFFCCVSSSFYLFSGPSLMMTLVGNFITHMHPDYIFTAVINVENMNIVVTNQCCFLALALQTCKLMTFLVVYLFLCRIITRQARPINQHTLMFILSPLDG